jgi:hypothetical protein
MFAFTSDWDDLCLSYCDTTPSEQFQKSYRKIEDRGDKIDTFHVFFDKIENIFNPTSSQQVKSLGSFIKRSLELRTGGT